MKTLETQFVSGEGGFSSNPLTYIQVQRNGKFAVYERCCDGKVKDYETIVIRTLKAGTKIFKQTLTEDEERYPGTSQWGHYAWSFGNKSAAINKLNQLVKSESTPVIPKEQFKAAVLTPKKFKGRPKTIRPTLSLPTQHDGFTMKQLLKVNPQWTQPLAYMEIKKLVSTGRIVIAERVKSKSARGRASVVYKIID